MVLVIRSHSWELYLEVDVTTNKGNRPKDLDLTNPVGYS